MTSPFDRSADDIGNILHLEHLNIQVPDQNIATLFYVVGLGLTRDPYMWVGPDNMWVNLGRNQFHVLTGPEQVVNGRTGIVMEDLDALQSRLELVKPKLAGTRFAFERKDGAIHATCPWGNLFICYPPGPAFGRISLGMPYIEIDVVPGAAAGIARFYREIIGARTQVLQEGGTAVAAIQCGSEQQLRYRETPNPGPYDGWHLQINVGDFNGVHAALLQRGLVTQETNTHQYRFVDVVDLDDGRKLAAVEHEVRSAIHPLYGRPLVNRNPLQSGTHYAPGQDSWVPKTPPIFTGRFKFPATPG